MAKRDIWIVSKWVNAQGIPVQRARKKYAYWEKGQTYPQDAKKRRTLRNLEKNLGGKGEISVNQYNSIWNSMMGRK